MNYANLYGDNSVGGDTPGFEGFGHFTQVVWMATTAVGCYTNYCSDGISGSAGTDDPAYFLVCDYSPFGEYSGGTGQTRSNV